MVRPDPPLIVLLGPTAVGKTQLAARLAHKINAEVISADSRQVFRGMDIGTGKDWDDYIVNGERVLAHLIDIAEPGTEFSVFSFMKHFVPVFEDIQSQGKYSLVCGGTGLYLEALLKGYDLVDVPVNEDFRNEAENISTEELVHRLTKYRKPHNTTDILSRERLIRALEIEVFRSSYKQERKYDFSASKVFGLRFQRPEIRRRISKRLRERLENGMIEEVKELLSMGIDPAMLLNYGLEYHYLTRYLLGELEFNTMAGLLETAIHQFAKRQMTWFRRMEKGGIHIHWLEGEEGTDKNLITILAAISAVKK